MKRCTKCAKLKPSTAFSLDRSSRDGLQGRCKACQSKTMAERRAALRTSAAERQPPPEKRCPRCEQVKAASEFGRDPNVRSGLKAYCIECLRKAARERIAKDPEKHREQVRRYRKNNPERARKVARERMRQWRSENLEQQRAYARDYHKKRWREDPEYRERFKRSNATRRKRSRGGTLTPNQWIAMLDFYGGACLVCGSGHFNLEGRPLHERDTLARRDGS